MNYGYKLMVYNSIIIIIRMNENINKEYIDIINIIMMYTYVKVYIYREN